MDNNDQKEVWNKIAGDWFKKRTKPFRQITKELEILSGSKPGKILEIGCGNCRNLLAFAKKGFDCYGIDFSEEMIKYAKEFCKNNNIRINLGVANAENLPFKDNYFDYALFVAVLHHVADKEKALLELKRVLRKEGIAIITVWNKWQARFFFKPKHHYVPWFGHMRYYYLFNYFELKNLIKKAGLNITRSYGIFGQSLVFVVKK